MYNLLKQISAIFLAITLMGTTVTVPSVSADDTGSGRLTDGVIIEAESGVRNDGAMRIRQSDNASGGMYITAPTGEYAHIPNKADALFNVFVSQAGSYDLWIKVLAESGTSNKLYISVGGGNFLSAGIMQTQGKWQWVKALSSAALKEGYIKIEFAYGDPNLKLDAFALSSDPSFDPMTAPKAIVSENVISVPAGAKVFEADKGIISIEAEKGVLSPVMAAASSSNVSGGRYVVGSASARLDNPDTEGLPATYYIKAPFEGSYTVYVRRLGINGGMDSYYFALNDEKYTQINLVPGPDWMWDTVKVINLKKGLNKIKFLYREPGVCFDKVIISGNHAFTPADMGDIPANLSSVSEENAGKSAPTPYGSVPAPPKEHPRLYLTKAYLPVIKENIQNPKLKSAWDKVLADSKKPGNGDVSTKFDKSVLRTIEANALLYIIDDNMEAGKRAVSMAEKFITTVNFPNTSDITRNIGEAIVTYSIVYDWCYSLMNNEKRKLFISKIKEQASGMEVGYPPVKQGAVVGHGGEAQIFRDMLSAGIACYDEDQEIYNFAAGRIYKEFVPARNFLYPSNAHYQGDSYGPYRYSWELVAALIFTRMGFENPFVKEQANLPYYWLYMRRPDGGLMRDGDSFKADGTEPFAYCIFSASFLYNESLYKDPYANNEFLRQYSLNPNEIEPIWMVLFYDPTVGSKPPGELPLTRYFSSPVGVMYARTGWDMGPQSNTVTAKMKIGGWMVNNHQHLDAGNFEIYYKGGLATDSGIYQGKLGVYYSPEDKNYNKRTIAHNSLLIHDPDEVFKIGAEDVSNDGGQRIPANAAEPATIETIQNAQKEYHVANVEGMQYGPDENVPDFSYIKGDITNAYSQNKAKDVKRSMVFLNMADDKTPAAMIVYDKVTSARPDFKKTYLLHSAEKPEIQGDTITVKRTEFGYSGLLVNKNLLPGVSEINITTVGGPGHEFEVNGQNYDQTPLIKGHDGVGWRVEISPKKPAETTFFLNVMQVMDGKTNSRPLEAKQLKNKDFTGALIGNRAVFFATTGNRVEVSTSLTLPDTGEIIKVLVTDLKEGFWTVEAKGVKKYYEVTKEGGCLYFDGEKGSYSLTWTEKQPDIERGISMNLVKKSDNIQSVNIKMNNTITTYTPPTYIENDRIMVPMRQMFEQIGAVVEWDESTQSITARRNKSVLKLTVGKTEATMNGKAVENDVAPEIRFDTVYVPLGLAGKGLGAKSVSWDEITSTAGITVSMNLAPDESGNTYAIQSVQSSIDETNTDENISPQVTFDYDFDTYWAASGDGQWIMYDLGEERDLSAIGIAWHKGDTRKAKFDLLISADGNIWTNLMDKKESSGKTDKIERLKLEPTVKARYIKYVGYGTNDGNTWNSIKEFRAY